MKNILNVKTPSNIYMWWNFGSLISMLMIIQMTTGITLSMNYLSKMNMFDSSMNIMLNMNYGWMNRIMHSNTTSMLFILIVIHMTRNMMFKSFFNYKMWISGMIMLLMLMTESFMGYSLIWNQMSYWAMMVITNFMSTVPFIGKKMIKLIWGSFNINIILINRFLSLHFIIPMIMIIMMIMHMMILHMNKSNNPMGLNNKSDLIKLSPTLIIKDIKIFIIMMLTIINTIMINPFIFNNPDNFIEMNYFKTPYHIEPEWYFLFFYSILRSINNKMSGMMMLIASILVMFIYPKLQNNKFQSFNPINKILTIMIMLIIFTISFLSKKNVEFPFKEMNYSLILMYFFLFSFMNPMNKMFKKL